jgi:CubicO group peptidase (beta-lactamase class C family)
MGDMKPARSIVLGLSFLLLSALAASAQPAEPGRSPAPWPPSTPAAEGLNPESIHSLLGRMRSSGMRFHAVILLRHDRLVTEEYFPPWQRDSRQNMYSCAKSVLSTLFGIAQAEGRLPPLGSSALTCLPAGRGDARDPRASRISLEQLLTMTSGVAFMRAVDMAVAEDQVAFALAKPLAADPGSRFIYTSAGPHLLSAILQACVGQSAGDYAARKLFAPLGIRDWSWEADGTGVTIGGAHLSLTAMDCARIGYLYLKKGEWFGARVLPASWVEAATRTHSRPSGMNRAEDSGYGYLWWVDEAWGGFSAHGAGGQYIFVVPHLDLVAVFTGDLPARDFPVPWDLFRRYVLPAAGLKEPAQ